jgi:hypothetical protein
MSTGPGEAAALSDELARAVERWKAWFGRRDEVAARLVSGVTRWEWSTGRRHSLLPLHFERYPGRGRLLKEAPTPKAQHTQSGLAADGRLLVTYVFDYREEAFETFVHDGHAVADIVQFSPGPHIPLEHARIEREGGRVVRHESFRLNGYNPKIGAMGRDPDRLVEWLGPNGRFFLVEDYRYDGPLLREIAVYGETPGLGPHRYVDRVSYDTAGAVIGIDRVWENGPTQAVHRRRRKGQSLEELRAAAVAELVPAVADVVGPAGAGERVYCVELSYQAVAQYFPPLITLGFDRLRETLDEPDLAYRPMLSGGRTVELPDPDRLEACRQFDQEVRSGQRWSLGARMLRDAAAELTRRDWTGVLDVTADFVAFAVEPELDDLEDVLAASAPPERIAAWKVRGWLGRPAT